MTDFLDDFGWEDMAFWGGMAEEFAEEERERRRWEREQYRDPEDDYDDDFDMFSTRQPYKRPYSRRNPRRRPFEQYADDVCRKRKSIHDPLFGPSKAKRGLNGNPKNYTDTVLYGVQVKNAHLVSESFLRFVCTVLYGYPEQGIDCIVFDPGGKPVVDGHEVFAIFDAGTRTISINLRRNFANAVRVAEHGLLEFSMHSLIWSGMVGSFLHEFKHALDVYENNGRAHHIREEQERVADQWAAEAKTYFARNGHAEMPALSEEPYFGPLVIQFMDRVMEQDPPEWARKQRKMLEAGLYYLNNEAGFEIRNMQEFYELSYQGLNQAGVGRQLNDCMKKEYQLEEQIWQQEEKNEQALKEAIAAQHQLRIDYVTPDGLRTSHPMTPQRIFSKNYYLWVEAMTAGAGHLITCRIDRIENIVFLA
jgi:hypothetical protein